MTELNSLNLGRNLITGIKRNWFVGLQKLDSLSLYSNNISTIESHSFDDLVLLSSLDFGENPIECKPCGFKEFVEWSKNRQHIVLRGWCADEKSAISDVKVSSFGRCTVHKQPKVPVYAYYIIGGGIIVIIVAVVVIVWHRRKKSLAN
ncbi:protein slit-like [Mytilus trossulus]|uniref:protein slit-like n=1 Tax=Mytilus trossulus TaxID=6551 RepID=UPI003005A0B5